jgi:hypothetical protein
VAELLSQNWRTELDYGLGAELIPTEHLLLVASRCVGLQGL